MLLIIKEKVKLFTSWLELDIQVLALCYGLRVPVLFPFLLGSFCQLLLLVLICAKAVTKGKQIYLILVQGELQILFNPF